MDTTGQATRHSNGCDFCGERKQGRPCGFCVPGDDDGTGGSFSGWEDMAEEQYRMTVAAVE